MAGLWIVLCITALAFCSSAHGQGNVILSNDFFPPGSTRKAYVYDIWAGPISKEFGRVDVITVWGALIKTGRFISDGIFTCGVVDIPNSSLGGSASVILRVWDSRWGASFEESWYSGQTTIRLIGLGGGTMPPPKLADIGNFTGMPMGILSPTGATSFAVLPDEFGKVSVRVTARYGNAFRIMESTDLIHWQRVGAIQLVPPEGFVEWRPEKVEPMGFFQIEIPWDGPW